jgi:hypothetical protein
MSENEENVQDENVDPSEALGSLDFNVNDEYKPEPLIPKGTYHGVATKISFQPSQFCIVWDFCLHDNGGAMNDGETPIDGAHVFFRNWLPKPGDEAEMTKNGRNNKRQSKINMLKDFETSLGVDMSTPAKIAQALNESLWVGVEADLDVDIDEYQGKFRNVVNKAKKSSMY